VPASKHIPLSEAIDRYVTDGSSIAIGLGLETCIPFAAGHEIIRCNKRQLTLIGPISDILFDQLIGAGCVQRVRAAWVGNVITGSGYNFRRSVEERSITVEDHSNLTMAMALTAGAWGVPFLPTRTALGSDLPIGNANLTSIRCPFTGTRLTAVAAISPDVAIVAVQRADIYGNAHAWGNLGVSREACLASRHIILTAEEIVDTDVIRSDPNRVMTPGFRVSAVVHAPWGAHPSPMPGYYNRDHQMFLDYRNASRTEAGFAAWAQRWIHAVSGPKAYMALLGDRRRAELGLRHHRLSAPADFGY
jgi:glutaconate CoA-transferase subunit A